MQLFVSDVSLFDAKFFERADLLPPEKKQELSSFRHLPSKQEHILAWSLFSFAYLLETGSPACDVRLTYGEKGKPYVAGNPFYFSLSHSEGKVLCAVSKSEIGADIQKVKPVSDAVIARVLCQNERKILEESTDRDFLFTKLWTLKESYFKKTGEGIGAGLRAVDFSSAVYTNYFELSENRFISGKIDIFAYSVCFSEDKFCIREVTPTDLRIN